MKNLFFDIIMSKLYGTGSSVALSFELMRDQRNLIGCDQMILCIKMYYVSLDGDLILYSYPTPSRQVAHSVFYIKRGLDKRLKGAGFDYSSQCGQVRDAINWTGFD